MLSTEPVFVLDGVPVFPDHSDPNLFWYLPAQVALARRNNGKGDPIFSFINNRDPEGNGGGFLSIQVDLTLPPKMQQKLETEIEARGLSKKPHLSQVPFTDGTVQCVTLDAGPPSGGAGDGGATPVAGGGGDAPKLVNQVLGAAKPSLQGNNNAIFTLALSRDGAEVVLASLKGGQSLLGVIYQLNYTAMQPPLKVKVTAKMDQVYKFLGASVSAQYKFARADLSAAIERLKADKVIRIERTDTEGTAASGKELDEATKLFTDMIAKDFFTPMLIPGNPRTSMIPNVPYNPNMPYNPMGTFPPVNPLNPYAIGNNPGINGLPLDPFAPNPLNPSVNPLNPLNPTNPLTPGTDPFSPGTNPSVPGSPF